MKICEAINETEIVINCIDLTGVEASEIYLFEFLLNKDLNLNLTGLPCSPRHCVGSPSLYAYDSKREQLYIYKNTLGKSYSLHNNDYTLKQYEKLIKNKLTYMIKFNSSFKKDKCSYEKIKEKGAYLIGSGQNMFKQLNSQNKFDDDELESKFVWLTSSGVAYFISKMKTSHIENSIKFLDNKNSPLKKKTESVYFEFLRELKKRNVKWKQDIADCSSVSST